MNFRNKYLLITLRTIFGLLLIFSGVAGFLVDPSTQGLPEDMLAITQAFWNTGIFQMIKATEIIAGIMFVIGFLPALAAIFTAPIGIGIVVFNAMIAPSGIPIGVIFCLINAYFGYAYWDKYKALFQR
ncbi:MAG: hypothetical protein AABY13_02225 [Nanoarchaeota archaeon]